MMAMIMSLRMIRMMAMIIVIEMIAVVVMAFKTMFTILKLFSIHGDRNDLERLMIDLNGQILQRSGSGQIVIIMIMIMMMNLMMMIMVKRPILVGDISNGQGAAGRLQQSPLFIINKIFKRRCLFSILMLMMISLMMMMIN